MTNLPERIKQFRKAVGWSQVELAERAGVSKAGLNLLEAGCRQPTLKIVQKLAFALNISLSELVEEHSISCSQEAEIFFREFGHIKKLSKENRKLISKLIEALLNGAA